ncbi:MAG: ATP-dependent Clp protease proteolytic subunit [Parcubacteria group bacterium]|nr:ATP-dependent Clp protease proteolytic subunit [Parcubacteria group bacterium]
MLRPYDKRTTIIPSTYDWLELKGARIIKLFSIILSSNEFGNASNIAMMAEDIVADLMLMGQESPDSVKMLVHSPGGSVEAGLLIVNAIEHLQAKGIDVEMLVLGKSASMAAIIVASGTQGKRYALNRAIIHGHPIRGGMEGNPRDIKGQMEHMEYLEKQAFEIFAKRTKIPEYYLTNTETQIPGMLENMEKLEKTDPKRWLDIRTKMAKDFFDKETFLSAKKAHEAGIIDRVLEPGDPYLDTIFKVPVKAETSKEVR